MALTPEEQQAIITAVISAIRTNSLSIDQLTPVQTVLEDDKIELSGGRSVTMAVIKQFVINLNEIQSISTEVTKLKNTLNGILNEDGSDDIDNYNEIIDFLQTFKDTDNLAAILKALEDRITDSTDTKLIDKVDKVAGKGLSANDFTNADKGKLDGIESGANKYVHPETHPASMIEVDETHMFATASELNRLSGMESGANKYVHPETHPASMIEESEDKFFMTPDDMDAISANTSRLDFCGKILPVKGVTTSEMPGFPENGVWLYTNGGVHKFIGTFNALGVAEADYNTGGRGRRDNLYVWEGKHCRLTDEGLKALGTENGSGQPGTADNSAVKILPFSGFKALGETVPSFGIWCVEYREGYWRFDGDFESMGFVSDDYFLMAGTSGYSYNRHDRLYICNDYYQPESTGVYYAPTDADTGKPKKIGDGGGSGELPEDEITEADITDIIDEIGEELSANDIEDIAKSL